MAWRLELRAGQGAKCETPAYGPASRWKGIENVETLSGRKQEVKSGSDLLGALLSEIEDMANAERTFLEGGQPDGAVAAALKIKRLGEALPQAVERAFGRRSKYESDYTWTFERLLEVLAGVLRNRPTLSQYMAAIEAEVEAEARRIRALNVGRSDGGRASA